MPKNKKLKVLLLSGAMLTSGWLLSSCSNDKDEAKNDKQQPKKEVVSTPQEPDPAKPESIEDLRWKYRCKVRDSICAENGEVELDEQLRAKRDINEDENDIHEAVYPYSLGATMNRAVVGAGTKIIENAYQQVVDGLAKYNVSIGDAITQDSSSFYIKKGVISNWSDEVSKFDMCFTGIEDIDCWSSADYAWEKLIRALDTVINSAPYGAGQKKNMHTLVVGIFDNAKVDLVKSREAAEEKYRPFFSLVRKEDVGLSYGGEGSQYYGYNDLNDNWFNPPYQIIRRNCVAYDKNLVPDWFGDANTDYKLIPLGEGNWAVSKTTKDRKETYEFYDPKEIYLDTIVSDKPAKVGDYKFGYYPGDNFGTHVYSEEVVGVLKRQKTWNIKLPADVQHYVDSLKQEIAEKNALYDERWKRYSEADSIGIIMSNQKYVK